MQTVCQYNIYHIGLSFEPRENDEYEDITEQMHQLYLNLLRACPFLENLSIRDRYDMLRNLASGKNKKNAKNASLYLALSYKRKSLVCMASSRISCAYNLTKCLPSHEKILIFGERIPQANQLYTLLQKQYPGKVGRYHSKLGAQANRNTLHRFRDGEIRILITCKALDEGIDIPDVSIGIILSGTSVQRQRIQRLGRIIRRSEGKELASLYYLHLEDTTEDTCFLPNDASNDLFELTYLAESHKFAHPEYDLAASRLLTDMHLAGASDKVLAEAERCLQLGSVRSDWKLRPCDIDLKIKEQKYISDKNYWICMKKLAEYQ